MLSNIREGDSLLVGKQGRLHWRVPKYLPSHPAQFIWVRFQPQHAPIDQNLYSIKILIKLNGPPMMVDRDEIRGSNKRARWKPKFPNGRDDM